MDLLILQGNKARERDGTGIVQRLCVQTTGETRIQRTTRPRKLVHRLMQFSNMKVLKNDDVHWNKAVICSQHWSKVNRENLVYDLQDRVCKEQYVQNLEKSASKCAKFKAKNVVAAKQSFKF